MVNLNKTEGQRMLGLAGLAPDVIMEIATRAISFWNYQMTQEYLIQSMVFNLNITLLCY